MKTYYLNDGTLFVGDANEVKALAKSINRAWSKGYTDVFSMYCNFPELIPGRVYGLEIVRPEFDPLAFEGGNPYYVVHNASTVLRMLEML